MVSAVMVGAVLAQLSWRVVSVDRALYFTADRFHYRFLITRLIYFGAGSFAKKNASSRRSW
jgi:hypothetical protein